MCLQVFEVVVAQGNVATHLNAASPISVAVEIGATATPHTGFLLWDWLSIRLDPISMNPVPRELLEQGLVSVGPHQKQLMHVVLLTYNANLACCCRMCVNELVALCLCARKSKGVCYAINTSYRQPAKESRSSDITE